MTREWEGKSTLVSKDRGDSQPVVEGLSSRVESNPANEPFRDYLTVTVVHLGISHLTCNGSP